MKFRSAGGLDSLAHASGRSRLRNKRRSRARRSQQRRSFLNVQVFALFDQSDGAE